MPMVSGERSSSTSINSLGNGRVGARLAGGSCNGDFSQLHHQSLQQYLALELRHLAGRRSISEVLDEVEAQHGGRVGFPVAVTDLDEDRAQR